MPHTCCSCRARDSTRDCIGKRRHLPFLFAIPLRLNFLIPDSLPFRLLIKIDSLFHSSSPTPVS